MSDFVEIDTKQVDQMLATLSDPKIISDVINEGLEAMGNVYYQNIISSLRKEMGASADTTSGKWLYALSSGIKTHPDNAKNIFGVHALSDFRLRFFEGGTKPRYTKGHKITGYATNKKTGKVNFNRLARSGKGGYRGIIDANHFFSDGVAAAEQNAIQALTQSVYNALKNRGIDIQP